MRVCGAVICRYRHRAAHCACGFGSTGLDLPLLLPHRYYATEPGEFYFFHFDGGTSGEFFKEIVERHGDIIALRDSSAMRAAFEEMLEMFRRDARPSEGELSLKIHAILCMLMQNDAGLARGGESGGPIERVVTYIHTHLAEPLTVDMLAGCGWVQSLLFQPPVPAGNRHDTLSLYTDQPHRSV